MEHNEPFLFCVMGMTCAGKSTLFDYFSDKISKGILNFGLIEVGKEMRKRYPPEHFQGQSNPKHTAQEAWQIFLGQYAEHKQSGKKIILCDGQPRDIDQTHAMVTDFPNAHYIMLDVPHNLRRARAVQRFPIEQKENHDLTMKRLYNDYRGGFEVLLTLARLGRAVHVVGGSNPVEHTANTFVYLINEIMERHLDPTSQEPSSMQFEDQ